ncbi:Choline kinase [Pseudobutyrivibrio sp. JW11]|uniref:NTP transferase domain-containing protein n=1 Tax=Pseudobutyrivibrio sp. JW11 TaxID=1855302 RepID=UPI0008ECE05E|nr:NTP transferase domain-containing protein [Pseudobutyrivibrio sp. JW11]SFO34283.1 Choline kinase [Pseudobutyrivibrio sp. JW11]
MRDDITIIISAAGMGKRFGAGVPKALIDIDGMPLIVRQLELLSDCKDIRIVVGYKAEEVIQVVEKYRSDVTYLYNYDYETTGTAASFSKGLINSKDWVVALDGDLLVKPDDFEKILNYDGEVIGGCNPTTDNPVLMTIQGGKVREFSRERGTLEWTGLAKLRSDRLTPGNWHVYMMIEPLLPVDVLQISTKEIDTMNDYENALIWVRSGYKE